MPGQKTIAHSLIPLAGGEVTVCAEKGKAPDEVRLFEPGELMAADGRRFVNDNPSQVVSLFNQGGVPLPVDTDHWIERSLTGPAVGWIEKVTEKGGAIWASIEWTAEGRKLIEDKSYRFISPAFLTIDDHVVKLVSAGLTNKPALRNMQLASEKSSSEENDDMKKELCRLLGLAEDASEAAITGAVARLKEEKQLASERPDATKFVPKADYDTLNTQLTAAKTELASVEKGKAEAVIDGFVRDSKVAPASKDFWLNACSTMGLEAVKAQLDGAPKILPGKQEKPAGEGGKAELTAAQKAIAKTLNMTEEAYAAEIAAETKEAA